MALATSSARLYDDRAIYSCLLVFIDPPSAYVPIVCVSFANHPVVEEAVARVAVTWSATDNEREVLCLPVKAAGVVSVHCWDAGTCMKPH